MVVDYHYSKILPKLNKVFLGDDELGAALSLGWGVRPLHTIRRLFPSLTSKDYFEIGKMCAREDSPHGTESKFLSRVVAWTRRNRPEIKLIFTWADGMLGKPGYVYQSANFLYGGFIWTDTYFTADGEKVHPRATGIIGGRPSADKRNILGWSHFRGKQFRYVYFLCSHSERKRLLRESPFSWGKDYPKHSDLAWKECVCGKWIDSLPPDYDGTASGFSESLARSFRLTAQQDFDFRAGSIKSDTPPNHGGGHGDDSMTALHRLSY